MKWVLMEIVLKLILHLMSSLQLGLKKLAHPNIFDVFCISGPMDTFLPISPVSVNPIYLENLVLAMELNSQP